ncbi:hypothetical protein F511_31112 [Dorcoceras hygrometricum]|uniref:Uncharacterized protein n=1 Tax=Dorcoceras hygrometricum TaxID=472368 RepID=A0A2Z7BHJ5_9LAMI|nr:hypothetical protein F511_31112 [Dorcoceras hygrometricum]
MHCSSADASFLVNISSCFPLIRNQQLHCDFKFSSCISFVRIQQLRSFPKNQQMHCSSADAFHSDNSAVALFILGISLATGTIPCDWFSFNQFHFNDMFPKSNSILSKVLKWEANVEPEDLQECLKKGLLRNKDVLDYGIDSYGHQGEGCLPAFYEIVITQVLLAEPLGSLAFKMVQVRQLVKEQQVKLEISRWVALCLSKAYVFSV